MDFIFPNEVHVTWSVMIVLYPYITGLVAGSFIVSSLYFLFDRQSIKPVARFALAASFVFLLFAPLPLLIHLGQPQRALNIMVTPNLESAMAGFGFIYSAFLLLVALQIWFVFRSDFVARAKGKGPAAWLAKLILLGNLHESAATKAADAKLTRSLSGIGVPLACLLTGYVGFLFGANKANPWWSSSMIFVIFLFSAIVSGFAVVTFLYFVVSWMNRWKIDDNCVTKLGRWLWGFMIIAVSLELLELLAIVYERSEESELLQTLINEKLMVSYVVLQFAVLSLIPFAMLTVSSIFKLGRRLSYGLTWVAATLLLGQVLVMRWNVVIGGQLLSKSRRGFTSYLPGLWEKEGLVTAALVFTIPFGILWVFHKMIPLFPKSVMERGREAPS